jgi:hypothetical protein
MEIQIKLGDGSEWSTVTVDPRTLVATEEAGLRVSLFGQGYERDGVTSLREIIEEGLKADVADIERRAALS